MLTAFGVSYLWPYPGQFIATGMKVWLLGLLFLSCLKIKARELVALRKEWGFISWLVVIRMVALPILVFWITGLFLPQYQLPFGLLVLMPVGVTAAFFTGLLGGRASLTLALTVLTGLATPFWLPLVLSQLFGQTVTVSTHTLMLDLAFILILPLVIAEVLQGLQPKLVTWINQRSQKPTYGLLWLILLGTFSAHMGRLLALSWRQIGETTLITLGLFLLLAVLGWLIAYKRSKEEQIAASSGFMLMNYALAIYLATTFFAHESLVILVAVLADIPWNLGIIVMDGLFLPLVVSPAKTHMRRAVRKETTRKSRKKSFLN